MAEIILLQGRSGSGKSTALETLPPNETVIIRPTNKPMPSGDAIFKGRIFTKEKLEQLSSAVDDVNTKHLAVKYVVIEDFSHYFVERITSTQFTSVGKGNGIFEQYNKLAKDVMDLVRAILRMRNSMRVILVHHTEEDASGYRQFRVYGKLLAEKMDPVSYIRIVLHARFLPDGKTRDEKYMLQTNEDGTHQAKTPKGMFIEDFIPGDMYAVMKRIDSYEQEQAKKAAEQK